MELMVITTQPSPRAMILGYRLFLEAISLDHVAIMKKPPGSHAEDPERPEDDRIALVPDQSRAVGPDRGGDTVYFKDSGAPVTVRAEVLKVVQCDGLTPAKVKDILDRYGQEIGIAPDGRPAFYETVRDKRYCLLIFLMNARAVAPFAIDKTGFGARAAWVTVADIARIKK